MYRKSFVYCVKSKWHSPNHQFVRAETNQVLDFVNIYRQYEENKPLKLCMYAIPVNEEEWELHLHKKSMHELKRFFKLALIPYNFIDTLRWSL